MACGLLNLSLFFHVCLHHYRHHYHHHRSFDCQCFNCEICCSVDRVLFFSSFFSFWFENTEFDLRKNNSSFFFLNFFTNQIYCLMATISFCYIKEHELTHFSSGWAWRDARHASAVTFFARKHLTWAKMKFHPNHNCKLILETRGAVCKNIMTFAKWMGSLS